MLTTIQSDPLDQFLESRFVPQAIVDWFVLNMDDFSGSSICRLFQPIDRMSFLTQSQVNEPNIRKTRPVEAGETGFLEWAGLLRS
jgi:hypothetical protein